MNIEIKDSKLCIDMESIISSMNYEQKREVLAWLATDYEVVQSVIDHIIGRGDKSWSFGDPNTRQEILENIERSQLESPRYGWKPWSDIREKLKQIRNDQIVYWTLYHKIDPELSRRVFEEFRKLGIESNYTTKEADDDIKRIEKIIEETFKNMQI